MLTELFLIASVMIIAFSEITFLAPLLQKSLTTKLSVKEKLKLVASFVVIAGAVGVFAITQIVEI